jgi:superfamily I DNA and/or RNA helicase
MMRWLQSIAKQTSETLDEEADEVWHGLKKDWLGQLQKTQITDLSEPCSRHYQKHANVIGATCLETGKPDFISSSQFGSRFDLSIVDEVSKATPPELLLPALVGKRTLLVGDHRQLPPVFGESTFPEAVENGELEEVEFEKFRNMVTTSMFEHFFEHGDVSIKCGLCQQYRMHPQIMNAVNQFYADQPLLPGLGAEVLSKMKEHSLSLTTPAGTPWLSNNQHMVWIDSSRNGKGAEAFDEKVGTSRQNMAEAELCVHLLKSLLPQNQSIGLISLYRAQIQNINRLLKEESADPLVKRFVEDKSVNTVDQFQGSERDIIIVSLTRTDNKLTGEFIKDYRRINVAMSRARKLLIIIGRGETFDSGMVEVPAEEVGRSEARSSYKEIRQLAAQDDAYKRLQSVFSGPPKQQDVQKQQQPQKKSSQQKKRVKQPGKKKPVHQKKRKHNNRDRGNDFGNLGDAFSGVEL